MSPDSIGLARRREPRPNHTKVDLPSKKPLQSFYLNKGVVPNLGPPDVLGLQLPEILASRDGEGFWEL